MDQYPRNGGPDQFSHDPRQQESPAGGRRTAGGSGYREAEADQVRDWQRNTWYGPAPSDGNPFDEPEDAPELRESRSENVNEHVGDFWKQQQTGYQYSDAQPASRTVRTGRTARRGSQPAESETHPGQLRWILLGVGVFLIAAILILRFAIFSIQEITVIGNSEIPAEEIIRISGIRQGDGILTLNEKDVETRLESDYRLQFRYLQKTLPHTVTISVREREECCWLIYSGILYITDKNRMILYETQTMPPEDEDEDKWTKDQKELLPRLNGLVEVQGLKIRSGYQVGQTMMLTTLEQQNVFSELFLEMKVLNCTPVIKQADLVDVQSLMLQTWDGFTVSMGDMTNLHAKLRSMLLVREKLLSMGKNKGTINVVNPVSPFYSPPVV